MAAHQVLPLRWRPLSVSYPFASRYRIGHVALTRDHTHGAGRVGRDANALVQRCICNRASPRRTHSVGPAFGDVQERRRQPPLVRSGSANETVPRFLGACGGPNRER